MSTFICETIAAQAGFSVSVGNWIAPDGSLIEGTDYESHHWNTLQNHYPEAKKHEDSLVCMNMAIFDGYIRLVFRSDVCFQVGAKNMEKLWSNEPNYRRMMEIIGKLKDIDIHIFSENFYAIGMASKIFIKKLDDLQIRES